MAPRKPSPFPANNFREIRRWFPPTPTPKDRSTSDPLTHRNNEKQCSRQLQCEVPCSVGGVVNSSLFINLSWSSLSSTSYAIFFFWGGGLATVGGVWPQGSGCRGGSTGGGGSHRGEGGRGHFGPAAIYCTTTWCFALKGLRTIKQDLT